MQACQSIDGPPVNMYFSHKHIAHLENNWLGHVHCAYIGNMALPWLQSLQSEPSHLASTTWVNAAHSLRVCAIPTFLKILSDPHALLQAHAGRLDQTLNMLQSIGNHSSNIT